MINRGGSLLSSLVTSTLLVINVTAARAKMCELFCHKQHEGCRIIYQLKKKVIDDRLPTPGRKTSLVSGTRLLYLSLCWLPLFFFRRWFNYLYIFLIPIPIPSPYRPPTRTCSCPPTHTYTHTRQHARNSSVCIPGIIMARTGGPLAMISSRARQLALVGASLIEDLLQDTAQAQLAQR